MYTLVGKIEIIIYYDFALEGFKGEAKETINLDMDLVNCFKFKDILDWV